MKILNHSFNLKAKKEGPAIIRIEFFQQGTYVGQLNLSALVVSTRLEADIAPAQSEALDLELMKKFPHNSPDLTLIIYQTKFNPVGKYDIILYSEEKGVLPVGDSLDKYTFEH